VLFATYFGGPRVGIFASIAGGVVGWWAFLLPHLGFFPIEIAGELELLTYAGACALIIWGADGYRRQSDSWQETGGPPVASPTHQGFGSRLLARALEQFSGAVMTSFEPGGFICTMKAVPPEITPPVVQDVQPTSPALARAGDQRPARMASNRKLVDPNLKLACSDITHGLWSLKHHSSINV